jgi:ADP-ribosyl-[dinitrogen reductase] hydrolase
LTSVADRAAGCVLGLALGDAAGSPGGHTGTPTAMARNLARSLGERGRFDPQDVVERHLAWFRTGPPDVSTLTRLVLERVAQGEEATRAAADVWEQRGPEVSAGNGSVMYCAPLGAAFANRPYELVEAAPLLSGLTHHDERCKTAVLAVTLAVAALVLGEGPERALHLAVTRTLDLEGGEELEYLIEAAGTTRPVDGPDQAFCLFTAGLALQRLIREESFEEAIRNVVSLGGDTDTNAAVAGAIAGARDGVGGLPPAWLDRLQDREDLEREAGALEPLVERKE